MRAIASCFSSGKFRPVDPLFTRTGWGSGAAGCSLALGVVALATLRGRPVAVFGI
jgi:hypothetical protein